MKTLTLNELPVNVFFWRKNDPLRWLKMPDGIISPLAGGVPFQDQFVIGDPQELILSDPNWCSNCWKEHPHWPPSYPCSFCGSTEIPATLDDAKRKVAAWTGLENPHI